MILRSLFSLFIVVGTGASGRPATPAPAGPKWHPGHYLFVGHGDIKDEHIRAVHFRGVQRCYSWARLEPTPGRFDFSSIRNDLASLTPHGKQLVLQIQYKETPIPVREHLRLAQERLKLNYLFWSSHPKECFENVKKLLAEPDLVNDPVGGLNTALPSKAFVGSGSETPGPSAAKP